MDNIISSQSHIPNGVKQGGCLSPTLYHVHMNKVIEIIRKTILVVDMAQKI